MAPRGGRCLHGTKGLKLIAVRTVLLLGDPRLHQRAHPVHVDGVLFPDSLSDPTAFGFIPELEAAGLIPAVPG